MSKKIKKSNKKEVEFKQPECEVKKYLTKNVDIEISSDYVEIETFSGLEIKQNVFLKATYKPQDKMVILSNINGLAEKEITLMQLRAMAKSFTDLASVIERQEKLRELAEGFGQSMEETKKTLAK